MGFQVRNTGLGKASGSEAGERAFQYGALMVGAGLGERQQVPRGCGALRPQKAGWSSWLKIHFQPQHNRNLQKLEPMALWGQGNLGNWEQGRGEERKVGGPKMPHLPTIGPGPGVSGLLFPCIFWKKIPVSGVSKSPDNGNNITVIMAVLISHPLLSNNQVLPHPQLN